MDRSLVGQHTAVCLDGIDQLVASNIRRVIEGLHDLYLTDKDLIHNLVRVFFYLLVGANLGLHLLNISLVAINLLLDLLNNTLHTCAFAYCSFLIFFFKSLFCSFNLSIFFNSFFIFSFSYSIFLTFSSFYLSVRSPPLSRSASDYFAVLLGEDFFTMEDWVRASLNTGVFM